MSLSNIYKTLTSLDSQYVSFPAFAEATKIIEENIELYKHTKLAHHLLIFGESGTGKSSICNWAATRYERSSLSDREVIPVLVVSIPAAATISGIVSAMLKSLGDPFPDHGTTTARNSRVVTLCRECRVIAILFDEAQHLHDRGQWATHYMVGDWLKALIDKIAVPTTFLGLPRLEQLLQVNEQLRRRFSRRIWLDLGQDDGAAHVACLQLFSTLAASLPIQVNHSPYSWEEFAARLYYSSGGRIAYLKRLLTASTKITLESSRNAIDIETLEQAFTVDVWWEGTTALNPFNSNFVFRKLDRQGEPFEVGSHRQVKAKRGVV